MNNFKIDTTGDNQQVCEKIKSFIDEESKKKDFKILISELASILEIPESVISLKVKRLFRSKYSYERGSFELKTSYYKIFSNYLTSIFLLIFNLLPKPKYKKFFNLIIDDINEFDQAKDFTKLFLN